MDDFDKMSEHLAKAESALEYAIGQMADAAQYATASKSAMIADLRIMVERACFLLN